MLMRERVCTKEDIKNARGDPREIVQQERY